MCGRLARYEQDGEQDGYKPDTSNEVIFPVIWKQVYLFRAVLNIPTILSILAKSFDVLLLWLNLWIRISINVPFYVPWVILNCSHLA